MGDTELEAIKRKKLHELQKKMALEQQKAEQKKQPPADLDRVLDKAFKYRAWEVYNAACFQFPDAMKEVKAVLAKLIQSGELAEIDGEQLYLFLRSLGLNVRLETEIKFLDKGESKSLSQKLKESS